MNQRGIVMVPVAIGLGILALFLLISIFHFLSGVLDKYIPAQYQLPALIFCTIIFFFVLHKGGAL